MKSNTKKYLIYLRYLLPIFAYVAIIIMLFVPCFRFVFSGTVGERMSLSTLISNSWEQARGVLFGTAEATDAAIIFSKTLFALIIALVILLIFSACVSIWAAIVAFRCFLSDDEESAEASRRTLIAFIPNRIVLCVLSALGLLITALPYLMKPIYAFTYSQMVTAVLEAPDALIVGGTLLIASCVLSVICAPMERELDADTFKKDVAIEVSEVEDSYDESITEEAEDIDSEARERIRRLFNNGDNRDNSDNNDNSDN